MASTAVEYPALGIFSGRFPGNSLAWFSADIVFLTRRHAICKPYETRKGSLEPFSKVSSFIQSEIEIEIEIGFEIDSRSCIRGPSPLSSRFRERF
jgi:hypothetical protein